MIGWLFCGGLVRAQEGIRANERLVMDISYSPVVWIDSMRTDMAHLVMDKAAIDSLFVMKDSMVSKKYSRVIARGSLIIVPKTTVELVRWPAFLEQRGVPSRHSDIRVIHIFASFAYSRHSRFLFTSFNPSTSIRGIRTQKKPPALQTDGSNI